MYLTAFGDSITFGYLVDPSESYINRLVKQIGQNCILRNLAVGGSMMLDNSWLTQNTVPSDVTTIMVGTNDSQAYNTNWYGRNLYVSALRSIAIIQGNAGIIPARNMIKTGLWSDTTGAGAAFGVSTTDPTAKLSATVSGTVVYLGFDQFTNPANFPASFEVWIDGTLVESVTLQSSAIPSTALGRYYGPCARRYAGLSDGNHTIEVRNKSAVNFAVEYVAGNGQLGAAKPVFVLNTPFKASYQPTDNAANVAWYAGAAAALVDELASDGFKIYLVDVNALINTTTDLHQDGVHLNAEGHTKIYNALLTAIQSHGLQTPGVLNGPFSFPMADNGQADIIFDNGTVTQITVT